MRTLKMRAVVIREPGGPEVLEVREVDAPDVPDGHVRVAVRFAGVEPRRSAQRLGLYPAPPGAPQDVPGLEYSRRGRGHGEGRAPLRAGRSRLRPPRGRRLPERVVAHEREVAPVPEGLTDEEAAGGPRGVRDRLRRARDARPARARRARARARGRQRRGHDRPPDRPRARVLRRRDVAHAGQAGGRCRELGLHAGIAASGARFARTRC